MAKGSCAYEDCFRLAHTSGVCQDHYLEEYRIEATYDVDDFWEFVKKELRIRG